MWESAVKIIFFTFNFSIPLKGTFYEYLTRNGLEGLEDLFTASHTLQGYGRIRDIPAFYGILWNTPKVVQSLIELALGKSGGETLFKCLCENLFIHGDNYYLKTQMTLITRLNVLSKRI